MSDRFCHALGFHSNKGHWSHAERVDLLEALETHATRLDELREGGRKMDAELRREIFDYTEICTEAGVVPPPSLVALLRLALGISDRPRSMRKNGAKYLLFLDYVSRNPAATASQIKRAIKYDQPRQIKAWLEDAHSQRRVHERRQLLQTSTQKSSAG